MLEINQLVGFGVDGESAAGHNYWRIYYTGADSTGGYQVCSDLEMRGLVGGSDLTGAGTASASSSEPDFPPANAFDGSTSSTWSSGTTGTGQWFKYDFGIRVNINQIAYLAHILAARGPTGIRLEYSDDDVTWVPVKTWTPAAWVAGNYQTFNV